MELAFLLFGLQTAAALAGGLYLWRRQDRQGAEIARLREALAAAQAAQAAKAPARRARGAAAEVIAITTGAEAAPAPPLERARRAWNLGDVSVARAPGVSGETARGLTLGILALAPAVGLAFGADIAVVVACGLAIGAAMMTIAHRQIWSAAAWAGIATAGGWALIGLAVGSAQTDPVSYSICVSLAAATGLVHAHVHRARPGATMALTMAAAAIALGSQIGLVSASGVALGFIIASAAIVGAMSLRLEGVHLAAFAATLIGLFVLSGQDGAAIWFTPAATWAGALFFGIAAVRVPQVGARGVAIAGTGVLAPLAAIAALHLAQQGLADRFAAASAYAVLVLLLAGVIAAATIRRERGLDALRATLWVLSLGAFAAFAASVSMALPAPAAAPVFALAALGLATLDLGLPSRTWRAFACICGGFSGLFAFASARLLLTEASSWPAWTLIAAGVAAPALIITAAAFAAKRRQARLSAAFLELVVILMAVAAVNLAVRVLFAGGALMLVPISFAEAGAHIGVWLASAWIIRWRARYGVRPVRIAAANVLLVGALGATLAAAGLWMTPYWGAREAAVPVISRDTFGFLIPAALFFANWRLWRSRNAEPQARLSLGAGALLSAAFVAVEVVRADGEADWIGAVIGGLAFAMAIGANFAPGIVRQPR
ncbi:MAG: hypothetical protein ACT4OF_15645 [Caulobacteraceae bacterium]